MARARNIKPGFFKNEDLAECSPWARLCFAGLWTLADRDGRLEDRPKRIKGELFPFDSIEVEPLLQELESFNFILRYETDGMKAIQILEFAKHQTPHYSEKKSIIKPPHFRESDVDDENSIPGELQERLFDEGCEKPGTLQENSEKAPPIKRGSQPPDSLNPDSLNPENNISSSGADHDPPGFARFWGQWPKTPRKVGKAECRKRWKARGLEVLADQIVGHVQAMRGTKQWLDGFEPAPLTYLNQRRWEDGDSPGAADEPWAGAI